MQTRAGEAVAGLAVAGFHADYSGGFAEIAFRGKKDPETPAEVIAEVAVQVAAQQPRAPVKVLRKALKAAEMDYRAEYAAILRQEINRMRGDDEMVVLALLLT